MTWSAIKFNRLSLHSSASRVKNRRFFLDHTKYIWYLFKVAVYDVKGNMKYHFKIRKEKDGYSARCLELTGCITQGDTLTELHENMQEALNLYIQEPENSSELAALPNESIRKSKNVVEVALDPQIAFSFMVRYCRLKHGMTQQQAARKMGFDTIYSYQRLEAKKCNPSLKIISKIKQVFPEFSIDYAVC
jgi:predicted RNase H-like HicB family nuclease/DNA-binding XRE family transcriptional regulator